MQLLFHYQQTVYVWQPRLLQLFLLCWYTPVSYTHLTRPVLVRLEEPKKTVLPSLTAPEEEGEKAVEARDEAFRDFIKETLGTGLFSSIHIL